MSPSVTWGLTSPGHGHHPSPGSSPAPCSGLEPLEGPARIAEAPLPWRSQTWPIPLCRPRLRPRNKQKHWLSECDWPYFTEMETQARGGQGTCWRPLSSEGAKQCRLTPDQVSRPPGVLGVLGAGGESEKMHTPISPPGAARERARARGCRGQRLVAPSTTSRQTASVIPGGQRLSCGTLVHGTSLSLHLLSTDQQKPPEEADALACQGPGAEKVPTPSVSQRPGCSSGCGRL